MNKGPKQLMRIVAVITSTLITTACEEEDKATCESATENYYNNWCAVSYDGSSFPKSEAIAGCKEDQEMTRKWGCSSDFNRALECIVDISNNANEGDLEIEAGCNSCDSLIQGYYDCVSAARASGDTE